MSEQVVDSKKVCFRHIRVTETVRDGWGVVLRAKQEHVLTLATRLEGNKLFVGYALNRVPKVTHNLEQNADRHDPAYARQRAEGRLNSKSPIVLTLDKSKSMIDNLVAGLLALPTEGSAAHTKEVVAVPSALKNVLRKSVREHKNKTRIEG